MELVEVLTSELEDVEVDSVAEAVEALDEVEDDDTDEEVAVDEEVGVEEPEVEDVVRVLAVCWAAKAAAPTIIAITTITTIMITLETPLVRIVQKAADERYLFVSLPREWAWPFR